MRSLSHRRLWGKPSADDGNDSTARAVSLCPLTYARPIDVQRPNIPAVQKILGRTYFLVGPCFSTPSASAFHCSAVCSNTRLLCGSFVFAASSAHLDALTR
jgi:hypothetical protein